MTILLEHVATIPQAPAALLTHNFAVTDLYPTNATGGTGHHPTLRFLSTLFLGGWLMLRFSVAVEVV